MSVDQMPARPAEATTSSRNAPVIVMTYAGSGAGRLRSVLSSFPELACTQRTGILPLCHQAVTTWQTVDGDAGEGVSRLAVGPWTGQQIRNLLMDLGDRAADFRFLVRDGAGQFTTSCDAVLADVGIEAVKIPPRSPRAKPRAAYGTSYGR